MFEYPVKVLRVVDGDTVDVDIDLGFGVWMRKQRIRMLGIDTPESRTRDKVEKVYGLAAKAFLKDALKAGPVTLRTVKDGKGKFGRILGEFIVNQVNINEFLIVNYHAVAYQGQSKEDIAEQHIANRSKVQI
jgi:micrococcal nuclease